MKRLLCWLLHRKWHNLYDTTHSDPWGLPVATLHFECLYCFRTWAKDGGLTKL